MVTPQTKVLTCTLMDQVIPYRIHKIGLNIKAVIYSAAPVLTTVYAPRVQREGWGVDFYFIWGCILF